MRTVIFKKRPEVVLKHTSVDIHDGWIRNFADREHALHEFRTYFENNHVPRGIKYEHSYDDQLGVTTFRYQWFEVSSVESWMEI